MDKRRSKLNHLRTNRSLSVRQNELIMDAQSIDIPRAIAQFLSAKVSERTAPRTVKEYQRHLGYLSEWLAHERPNVKKLRDVSISHLRDYIAWMSYEKEMYSDHPTRYKPGRAGLAPTTVNIRIRTMKAFFNWCVKNGHLSQSPMSGIKQQRVDLDTIYSFTDDEIVRLLAAPDTSSFVGFRDYVAMVLMLDTGIRIGELLSLTNGDLNIEELSLTIQWEKAKTRKRRTVPVSPKTMKLLLSLVRENEDFGPSATHIFLSGTGSPLNASTIQEKIREYGRQAGITDKRVSPHSFRHSFALHWIKAGGDPFSLQKILGHSDISMVRRYVRMNDSDLKEKHEQFSPAQGFLN
ncbi:tyrosine-type recombinase/integrase [Alicyclobacillus fastidiosus]|uniref:Tyrosine-type recombinase/integrase n=1 Tax=Alicyclobacillus fastidiosus TaxID=392011 RepID=A0ABV5AIE5_9BACL|nr:tyrosine-type recombinase/integrase [Alicyclobacillus fastidiosus]WEH11144.1 tyrosine-type recombinase/integrase [Alicyclobacillus fastidiosus]